MGRDCSHSSLSYDNEKVLQNKAIFMVNKRLVCGLFWGSGAVWLVALGVFFG